MSVVVHVTFLFVAFSGYTIGAIVNSLPETIESDGIELSSNDTPVTNTLVASDFVRGFVCFPNELFPISVNEYSVALLRFSKV